MTSKYGRQPASWRRMRSLFALSMMALLSMGACARDVAPASPSKSVESPAAASADTSKVAAHADAGAHAGCIYTGNEADGAGVCGQVEPDAPTQSTGHFGAPFAGGVAVPLAKAIGEAAAGPVLVSGTVEAVCQKKGCWMVIKDGDVTARVMMKEHAFAVPIDSRGKAVLVQGELGQRSFSEAQAKHLEQDRGGDPQTVAGARQEHVLMATGVEIRG